MDPSPKQCSTSKRLHIDASPKAISERTSYLQVRLEFLRYPQVIQALFNVPWFGPPVRLTAPSTCSWVGHMVSGLRRSEEHTSELQSRQYLVCRLLLEKKKPKLRRSLPRSATCFRQATPMDCFAGSR